MSRIPIPRRVSKFKSDRGKPANDDQKASVSPKLSTAKAVLGSIVEIKDLNETPLGEVVCTPSGFPPTGRTLSALASYSPSSAEKRPTFTLPADAPLTDGEDFASMNLTRVVNMSESDVQR